MSCQKTRYWNFLEDPPGESLLSTQFFLNNQLWEIRFDTQLFILSTKINLGCLFSYNYHMQIITKDVHWKLADINKL